MTEDEIELKIKDIQNYNPEKFQREFFKVKVTTPTIFIYKSL
jgi:hypothetical protein